MLLILDAREHQEYKASHLKDAIYVGYDDFNLESVQKDIPNKDQDIVVYCSLGIRSEDIAKKLKKAGYTNVKNLYGGIFEWKNKAFLFTIQMKKKQIVFIRFQKNGVKWLTKGIKIYE